jgi:hypothetical protein
MQQSYLLHGKLLQAILNALGNLHTAEVDPCKEISFAVGSTALETILC